MARNINSINRNNPQRAKHIPFELCKQFDNSDVNTDHENSESDPKLKNVEVSTEEETIVDLILSNFEDEFEKEDALDF